VGAPDARSVLTDVRAWGVAAAVGCACVRVHFMCTQPMMGYWCSMCPQCVDGQWLDCAWYSLAAWPWLVTIVTQRCKPASITV
jgi:hypothetical protein